MTETLLKPVKLNITMNGSGDYQSAGKPFPYELINDTLSQNILWNAYQEPKSAEEISRLCGVPAFYIDSFLDNLVKKEAMIRTDDGKYRTNFIIYGDREIKYAGTANEELLRVVGRDFIAALQNLSESLKSLDIYSAERSDVELIYLYGVLALEHFSKSHNPMTCMPHKVRYDGNQWTYHAHGPCSVARPASTVFRAHKSLNRDSSGTLSHHTYFFNDFISRETLKDQNINICEDILNGAEVQKDHITALVRSGYLKCAGGKLVVAIPYFDFMQKKWFDETADKCFADVIPKYKECLNKYVAGYMDLLPPHLKEDAMRACNYLFVSMFSNIAAYGQKLGLLQHPPAGSVCDVLIQWKEY